jgi:anaerobic selenocysteine-containing dehydrogenase
MQPLRVLDSVCPLDCPDTCALKITLRDGEMIRLEGSREHPATRGFACVKMVKYPQLQNHRDRLQVPLRRIGSKGEGKFTPITWDEALDTIAAEVRSRIERYGEQSVLPYSYAGTMGLIERDHPLAFFRGLGASELDWTICAATGGAGWEANYGPDKVSTPPEEVIRARLIILWGINALRSNSHLVPLLKQARHQGARIVHIDPYRNETSRFADEHWAIRVGTDTALALAIGGEILRLGLEDRDYLDQYANDLADYRDACAQWPVAKAAAYCGVSEEAVRELAQAIGQERSTFIRVGYGMTRNESGGNAMRAITLLPALTGAWRHAGGGAALSTSGAFALNRRRYSGFHLLKPDRRHVNQNQIGRALADASQPISALFVFNSNPAAVAPDSNSVRRGLARNDLFTVVLEHFQTDTADYADILLPATTFVEHPDLYAAYGHYHLQWADAILPPRAECRPNSWVFQQLASRLGLSDPVFRMSTEELASDLLDSDHPFLSKITWDRLKRERSIPLNLPTPYRPYAEGSHFPDAKIRFSPAPRQIAFQDRIDREYPLRLISPPGAFVINTSLGNLPDLLRAAGGEPTVLVHPDDAEAAGVADGTRISVSSRQGKIVRKALVTTDTLPGVITAVGQWWPKLAPDRRSLNDLTSQELTDLGGGSLFGNATVRISQI